MAFDVLSVEGEPVVSRPYSERRRVLEGLGLNAAQWKTPDAFDDGEALWPPSSSTSWRAYREAPLGPLHPWRA